jgi:pheromone shutdown protein TraB
MDDERQTEDEDYVDSGEESEVDDTEHPEYPSEIVYPSARIQRAPGMPPDLPHTVDILTTDDGCQVYLVGTAHFSESSQQDVIKTIQLTQPDVVVVELCKSRINILSLDEETLLREAKNINLDKIRAAIRQSGLVQGILHLLLLSMSAHITKQLGMAPGGEFRTAFREARKIPGCRIHLGDRPIGITLRRALGALSWYQKLRLAWYMITCKEPISKEEVERCKQKDLLEEMLREMTGEFPALSRVFVTERDIYLANSLRLAAQPIRDPRSVTGYVPSVAVGVVGIGHTPGIIANWNHDFSDVHELLKVPESSAVRGRCLKWVLRAGAVSLVVWGCYKVVCLSSKLVFLLPSR